MSKEETLFGEPLSKADIPRGLFYSDQEIENMIINGLFRELFHEKHKDIIKKLKREAKRIANTVTDWQRRKIVADMIRDVPLRDIKDSFSTIRERIKESRRRAGLEKEQLEKEKKIFGEV